MSPDHAMGRAIVHDHAMGHTVAHAIVHYHAMGHADHAMGHTCCSSLSCHGPC